MINQTPFFANTWRNGSVIRGAGKHYQNKTWTCSNTVYKYNKQIIKILFLFSLIKIMLFTLFPPDQVNRDQVKSIYNKYFLYYQMIKINYRSNKYLINCFLSACIVWPKFSVWFNNRLTEFFHTSKRNKLSLFLLEYGTCFKGIIKTKNR